MANCMSAIEGEFSDASSVTVERPPELAAGFEFSNQYRFKRDSTRSVLFFTSKLLLVLVISRPKKVDCVAFMAQHHHICQLQTGLHVFNMRCSSGPVSTTSSM